MGVGEEQVTRCERSELLTDDCSHCRGLDPTPAVARRMHDRDIDHGHGVEAALVHDVVGGTFLALYNGKCAGCGERFKRGTLVTWGDKPGELLCCD